MTESPRILAFSGSLRSASYNTQLVRIAAAGATAAGVETTVIDLRDYPMPLYDQDIEDAEGLPESVTRLKGLLFSHQGVLIATPEYNSGITAVLKNTIDWTSRAAAGEAPAAAWRDKIALLISASPGGFGGMRGLYHTRSVLLNIGVQVLPKHHFVSHAAQAFDGDGNLADAKGRKTVLRLGAELAGQVGALPR